MHTTRHDVCTRMAFYRLAHHQMPPNCTQPYLSVQTVGICEVLELSPFALIMRCGVALAEIGYRVGALAQLFSNTPRGAEASCASIRMSLRAGSAASAPCATSSGRSRSSSSRATRRSPTATSRGRTRFPRRSGSLARDRVASRGLGGADRRRGPRALREDEYARTHK